MKKVIQQIKKINFPISKELDYDSFKNLNDLFYTLNSQIFENSNLSLNELGFDELNIVDLNK